VTVDLAGEISAALAPLVDEIRALCASVESLRAATPPRLVDVAEACRLTGLSPATVRRRISDGTIPAVRLGRAVRVDLASLRPPAASTVAALVREARR